MSVFLRPSLSCQIPHLNELLDRYFPGCKDGTFVEVGANDGYSWSNTWALAELGWRGLYFEPVKSLACACREKHKNNNVIVINAAVGEFKGVTKLFLGEGCTTSDFVAKHNTFHYGNSEDNWIEVLCVSLNSTLNELGIPYNFELLVIDVDGDENGVLDGLDLELWQPVMIIIETSKDTSNIGWNFNAKGIDARLSQFYDEVYHDHINSVYVRSAARKEAKPMPSLFETKKQTILKYAGWYNCSLFIETGTGMGDMLDAVYPYFKEVYSIELADDLYRNAMGKFSSAPTIHLFHGDSGNELPRLLEALEGNKNTILFYLDAHYSGMGTGKGAEETPILAELKAILTGKFNSIILIDDLKDFVRNPAYPKPSDLEKYVNGLKPGLKFEALAEGGGMFLIVPAKKKWNEERRVMQITPKAITRESQAVHIAEEVKQEGEPRSFARPPMLYGPYRDGGKYNG